LWFRAHKDFSDTEKKIESARLEPAAALAAAEIEELAASTLFRSEALPNYFGRLISYGSYLINASPLALLMKSSGWMTFVTRMSGERPKETL